MQKKHEYLKSLFFAVIGFFVCAILGTILLIHYGFLPYNPPIQSPDDIDLSVFWEAWNNIEEYYINSKDLDRQEMVYGAVSGMVSSLGDPHTSFFNPQESSKFREDLSGEIEGVGMEIGLRNGYVTVIAPLKNTPAEKAGLQPGDQIIKVDDHSTIDITVEKTVELIRGEKGSQVSITIRRADVYEEKEFILTRALIQIPSVTWEIISDDIAYLRIHHFHEGLTHSFQNVAAEILKSPAQGIILDLRNNPGGYLDVAINVAGWFLPKEDVVAIEEFADSQQQVFQAQGNAKLSYYPMIIIINQGSASGSEILAGALRDNRKITIVGENSFGKGSVQQTFNLKDGSLVKITIAKWLTPHGYLIEGAGLEPDVTVEVDIEQYLASGKDDQLDKAVEILKGIIK